MGSGIPGIYKNDAQAWTPERALEGYGTIGVLSAERGTYAAFWNDVQKAHMWILAHPKYRHPLHTMDIRMGVDICGSLNNMIRGLRGDWLWIMGDDHAFSLDLLPQLLDHDVDVVVPHCLRRNPPWAPVVNSHEEDGWQVSAELPEEGLTEIWSAGSAGMLVKRRVFDAIGDPWFTPAPDAQGLNEDINFCRKIREAGFQIWCDPAALLGHISNYTVYPLYANGRWQLEHVFDQHTRIPIQRITSEQEVPA